MESYPLLMSIFIVESDMSVCFKPNSEDHNLKKLESQDFYNKELLIAHSYQLGWVLTELVSLNFSSYVKLHYIQKHREGGQGGQPPLQSSPRPFF